METIKTISVLAICSLFLLIAPFFCEALEYNQWVMDHWSQDKEKTFKTAKEKDKFVLLFVGRPTCPTCKKMSELFCNPANPIKKFIEDNFVTFYKCLDSEEDRTDVYEYIGQLWYERDTLKLVRQIPWLFIINPDNKAESVASWYRPYPEFEPDDETMMKFLSVDLSIGSALDWYSNEETVFELANAQNKNIFKFVGRGTSPDCQKMMDCLNEEPFKKILHDNYILYYINENDDCGCDVTFSAPENPEEGGETVVFPYISIINPKDPDKPLKELWGVQEAEGLEAILLKYTVSNEKIFLMNEIFVWGNTLTISNHTHSEQINVFTMTGQQLASIRKNDFSVRIDTSHFPKGVLIINSSAGWSAKFILE